MAAGRVVSAVLTACISCAFHGFYYFRPVDVALTKDPAAAIGVTGTTAKGTPAERLQKLDDAYDKGVINDREYRRLRAQILSEF